VSRSDDYHAFVPPPGKSNIAGATPRMHAQARMQSPRAKELFDTWAKLGAAPFKGLTTDGYGQPGLFSLRPEAAPTAAMVAAVNDLLARLSPAQRGGMRFAVDSQLWRSWQNTELYVEHHGLRLDEADSSVREATMAVLRASLSDRGYEVARGAMRRNRFLGDLVGGPHVLGEWAYVFGLFGEPSDAEPWGWQLFGHHLSLNCFVVGRQMVLTPCFFGTEPNYAETGPFAGPHLFEREERAGLALMRSLSPQQQERAIVAHAMMGGDLPPGRRHFADNLHLGGAFQDNRIVPYEGLCVSEMSAPQQRDLIDLIAIFLAPLPSGPLAARLADVERHLADTHFCWIGGYDEESPFYYRVQSPVIFIEFDHHAGVFLTNPEPAKFHTHTIVRTPNGNDYGAALLRLYCQRAPHDVR
jgi:hypothetical protein